MRKMNKNWKASFLRKSVKSNVNNQSIYHKMESVMILTAHHLVLHTVEIVEHTHTQRNGQYIENWKQCKKPIYIGQAIHEVYSQQIGWYLVMFVACNSCTNCWVNVWVWWVIANSLYSLLADKYTQKSVMRLKNIKTNAAHPIKQQHHQHRGTNTPEIFIIK